MGGAISMHRKTETRREVFNSNRTVTCYSEDQTWFSKQMSELQNRSSELDPTGSGYSSVVSFCDKGNEFSGYTKGGKFLIRGMRASEAEHSSSVQAHCA